MQQTVKRKFIILSNPISGTKNKDKTISYISAKLVQLSYNFELLHTNANGAYQFVLDKITNDNVTDVIIIGGDGTVNTVMNTLRLAKINIGIIPSGSGNGLALAAGISKDYKKALALIIDGKPQYIDAFECNGQFACMLCGIGFDAQVAHDFAKQKKRGLITYTKQSIKNFVTAKAYSFQVEIENKSIEIDAFFLSIANSNQFGNNFTIAPKASLNDGLLDIVIVQKMSKLKLPLAILNQLRGRNKYSQLTDALANNNIVYLQSDAIKIYNKSKAPFHIDGEAVATEDVFNFKIIKSCFKLYMP